VNLIDDIGRMCGRCGLRAEPDGLARLERRVQEDLIRSRLPGFVQEVADHIIWLRGLGIFCKCAQDGSSQGPQDDN